MLAEVSHAKICITTSYLILKKGIILKFSVQFLAISSQFGKQLLFDILAIEPTDQTAITFEWRSWFCAEIMTFAKKYFLPFKPIQRVLPVLTARVKISENVDILVR